MSHKVASVCITFSLTGMLLLSACGGSSSNTAESSGSLASNTVSSTNEASDGTSSSATASADSSATGGNKEAAELMKNAKKNDDGSWDLSHGEQGNKMTVHANSDGSWTAEISKLPSGKETYSMKYNVHTDGGWEAEIEDQEGKRGILKSVPIAIGKWSTRTGGKKRIPTGTRQYSPQYIHS